jgi:hypothetical protein
MAGFLEEKTREHNVLETHPVAETMCVLLVFIIPTDRLCFILFYSGNPSDSKDDKELKLKTCIV